MLQRFSIEMRSIFNDYVILLYPFNSLKFLELLERIFHIQSKINLGGICFVFQVWHLPKNVHMVSCNFLLEAKIGFIFFPKILALAVVISKLSSKRI